MRAESAFRWFRQLASAISAAGRGNGLGVVFNWGEDKFLEIFSDGANMFEGMKVLKKG